MKQINTYITEKLHLRRDNDSLTTYDSTELEAFIDSFKGEVKDRIIRLMKMCIHTLQRDKGSDNYECFIIKNNRKKSIDDQYKWSSSRTEHYKVGDKFMTGATILWVFKKGDKIPKRYL